MQAVKCCVCRYGAGKVSSGANVDGTPLPEDVEENGKEEEVGEFGFHTLVHVSLCNLSQVPAVVPHTSFTPCSASGSSCILSLWCLINTSA